MLQSPYFLYRTELGATGARSVGYEMAAKLSLWLRGTTPSDALLDSAAGPGKLDTADGAAALATTMLGEATATTVMRQFHGELLHFDRFANISKVGVPTYKDFAERRVPGGLEPVLRQDLHPGSRGEGHLDLHDRLRRPGDGAALRVSAPASGYVEKDLGSKRVGYFLQVPFLALYGFNGDPDSIHRGVTLNLDMLCATLGPPAANLPPIPPLEPGQTNRQRIDDADLAAAVELSQRHDQPARLRLRALRRHGPVPGHRERRADDRLQRQLHLLRREHQSWNDAAEPHAGPGATPQTHTCYAKKLASFGLQRDIVASDMPLLDRVDGEQHGRQRLGQADDHRPRQERRVPHPRRRHPVKRKPEGTKVRSDHRPRDGKAVRLPAHVRRREAVTFNRRAFLRGAGTVAIGLPFLEGLPERSAWAASSPPVFSFFMVAACGVVGNKFFPSATGALTTAGLAGSRDGGRARWRRTRRTCSSSRTSIFPNGGPKSAGTPRALPVADRRRAGLDRLHRVRGRDLRGHGHRPGGERRADPFTLYAGSKSYIAERISFRGAGAGQVRPADLNPYTLYAKIVGLTTTSSTGTTTTDPVAAELIRTRKSVNDLVRGELNSLMSMSTLSSADKQRLKQHFDSIRDVEVAMGTMGATCTQGGCRSRRSTRSRTGSRSRPTA